MLPCPYKTATVWQSKLVPADNLYVGSLFSLQIFAGWPILAAAAVRTARALKSEPLLLVAVRLPCSHVVVKAATVAPPFRCVGSIQFNPRCRKTSLSVLHSSFLPLWIVCPFASRITSRIP